MQFAPLSSRPPLINLALPSKSWEKRREKRGAEKQWDLMNLCSRDARIISSFFVGAFRRLFSWSEIDDGKIFPSLILYFGWSFTNTRNVQLETEYVSRFEDICTSHFSTDYLPILPWEFCILLTSFPGPENRRSVAEFSAISSISTFSAWILVTTKQFPPGLYAPVLWTDCEKIWSVCLEWTGLRRGMVNNHY